MRRTSWLLPVALLLLAASATAADPGPKRSPKVTAKSALTMSPAIACKSIEGYETYESLPDAMLTSDEKLLVYYRPLNYRVDYNGGTAHIHLVQDGLIRRRGEKTVLLSKTKLLDYDWKGRQSVNPVYLRNTISLKGLMPGEYDYDIILRDKLAPGAPVARQTLHFRVIPPDEPGEARPSGDGPSSP